MPLVMYDNEKKSEEEKLHGIVPQHYFAYRVFKFFRFIGIFALVLVVVIVGMRFIRHEFVDMFTNSMFYPYIVLFFMGAAVVSLIICLLILLIWLRKPPFDPWVFEFAEKRLGTEVIYYNSRCLYIQYDRASTKEVDKKDFVTEMSDQSEHYSYYYIDTFIDLGIIQVECEKRSPIPDRASFSKDDDPLWNMIPVGLTINPELKTISPIGWFLNDNSKSDKVIATQPSVSFLICGGPLSLDTKVPTTLGYKTIEEIKAGDSVFDIHNNPVKVLSKSEIFKNKTCYRLVFNNGENEVSFIASLDHRFPILIDDKSYEDIQCKDLKIGDTLLGNFSNYTLGDKIEVGIYDTQCILIDSPQHEFLLACDIHPEWLGGETYPYPAVYTRNTGCHVAGEKIIVPNTLVTDLSQLDNYDE